MLLTKNKRLIFAASLLFMNFLLVGCAQNQTALQTQIAQMSAQQLFASAQADLKAGDKKTALQKLTALNTRYVYSQFSKQSLMLEAYLDYEAGEYQDAINAAKRYTQLYPGAADSDYAYYVIATSYFAQMPTITQDQAVTLQSAIWFTRLIKQYPQSKYVLPAQEKLAAGRNQLAGKDMEIGRYYLKRQSYLAAINRFTQVIQVYSDTPQIEEALSRLVEAYYAMGLVPSAQNAAAILGRNYPDSPWYRYAYDLLQKKGISPQSDHGTSWLSKKFHS